VTDFDNKGYPGFLFTGSPWTVAVLAKDAAQDFNTCHTVNYGGNESANDPADLPAGTAISEGRAVCLRTPAGNTALLQFRSAPGTTITVSITVWSGHG
jgi:hypothetical protein